MNANLRHALRRSASTSAAASPLAASSALNVFDARTKRLQRDRASSKVDMSRLTDYIRDQVAAVMVDRLLVRTFRLCLVSP
jgi:NADH dehydrogenase [ubiquinone] 1 alpha subcomplex assembly factor 5